MHESLQCLPSMLFDNYLLPKSLSPNGQTYFCEPNYIRFAVLLLCHVLYYIFRWCLICWTPSAVAKRCSGALFSSLFFFSFFCRGDEQLRFSVDEELAVPQTIAFVCWNCLTSCKPESGST